jgi:Transposase DDE domain
MAAHVSQVLARLRRDPFADLPIAAQLNQLLAEQRVVWRDRLLTPLVTLRLFLIQIAHGNCAIAALRQLGGIAFAPSSYCEARARLPLPLLQSLLLWMQELGEQAMATAAAAAAAGARCARRRILILDGSSYTTPDTPELVAHFHFPPQSNAAAYPMGKLMGLLDAGTGMFLSLLALPLLEHDMRGGIDLHPMLRAGDILVGDRAFCSFAHFALLQARGAFACMRLHQGRKDQTPGRQLWIKPRQGSPWMARAQYALLPQSIEVRIVQYTVAQKGFRSRTVLIATTLLNPVIWPDQRIAELYGHRWQIETCFGHHKTTMKMNVLRCKTLAGVMKELAIYLVVYNLIRLVMLSAGAAQQVDVRRVSFVDAMRLVAARMIGLDGVERLIVNPDRTGRSQLRMIRSRPKAYDWLRVTRRQKEAEIARKQAEVG